MTAHDTAVRHFPFSRQMKPLLAELAAGDGRPLEAIAAGLSGGGAVVADEGQLRAMCQAILAKQQKCGPPPPPHLAQHSALKRLFDIRVEQTQSM
jgi:hypothetical protein